jgi:hypothetical protein
MKKFVFITIILIITIILTIFYSVYIYNVQNSNFVNWLNTLIATVISVLLALTIAIYIFYYQTKLVEEETRDKFIPLIESNLISIWKGLADLSYPMKYHFRNGEEENLYLYYIQDIIFEQAIISNVFNQTQIEFLLSMRNYIHYNNRVMEIAINMDPLFTKNPDSNEENIKALILNNKASRKSIKETIELANKYFKFNKLNKEVKQNNSNTLE